LLTAAVTGLDLGDPDARPDRPPRVGICRSPVWDRAAAETQDVFDRLPDQLARAGASVRDLELPPEFDGLEAAHGIVMSGESARALGWEMNTAPDKLSPALRQRMEWGLARSGSELRDAQAVFRRLQTGFGEVMAGLDILVTPSAPGVAPVGLEWTGDPAFNFIWTSLHVPCVTVPAGTGPGGMPLGVQIVAPRGEDRAALMWSGWVAAALG
jgi:Asp-tRNA(Asn)/Glu-tRNA(Gln) amidotransferase A subunit family amidase